MCARTRVRTSVVCARARSHTSVWACVLALALWPTRAEPVALIAAMMGGLIRDAKREQRRAAERGEQLDGGEVITTTQTAREVEAARAEGEKEARAWLDQ